MKQPIFSKLSIFRGRHNTLTLNAFILWKKYSPSRWRQYFTNSICFKLQQNLPHTLTVSNLKQPRVIMIWNQPKKGNLKWITPYWFLLQTQQINCFWKPFYMYLISPSIHSTIADHLFKYNSLHWYQSRPSRSQTEFIAKAFPQPTGRSNKSAWVMNY